jgi:transposase-like protein
MLAKGTISGDGGITGLKDSCPYCHQHQIIRYGWRGSDQIFYCRPCRKKFTKKPLKNKGYSSQVIMSAISSYNLGSTLEAAAKIANKQFKVTVSKSSVHSWIGEFSDICTYQKLRPTVMKKYCDKTNCDKILYEYHFHHSGLIYNYVYHAPKLEMLCHPYSSLIRYLKDLHKRCPSDVFEEGERCSQVRLDVSMKKEGFYNQACRLAGLALTACKKKTQRHSIVERFMLINDSSTIACEVPVWFWDKCLGSGVSGHIDIVQMRNSRLYVLDYKPGAAKENEAKVASQLYLYALGLSFRTGIPLELMRCAWFDEHEYYEFNPIEAKVKVTK